MLATAFAHHPIIITRIIIIIIIIIIIGSSSSSCSLAALSSIITSHMSLSLATALAGWYKVQANNQF